MPSCGLAGCNVSEWARQLKLVRRLAAQPNAGEIALHTGRIDRMVNHLAVIDRDGTAQHQRITGSSSAMISWKRSINDLRLATSASTAISANR